MTASMKGKVAVITGAAGSIGHATSLALGKAGAELMLVDVNAEGLAARRKELGALGVRTETHVADVSRSAEVAGYVAATLQKFGRIDAFFNNAGIEGKIAPTQEYDEDEYDRIIAVNQKGVFLGLRHVLPQMIRQKSGAIINISSLAAIRWTGYPYFAYYATKAAVNQATMALAVQYARDGIRANCIMPGMMDTPLIYKQISGQYGSVEEMVAARSRAVPLGRMGTGWDIANAAVFLASEEAQFITGVCLPVDGGQSCAVAPLE
jgi:NAD(P)-dependent dehydrogenase (short-subunit alcohol dehydrogenase family)